MMGMVAEYARRVTAERTADAKLRAVERGVPPFPNIPPYLRQRKDGTLEPIPKRAKVAAEAVQMRADGATIREVREHLTKHGIKMSYHGVQALLRNRMLLGELHFGDAVNLKSHRPIVDKATFQRAQRQSRPRGRRAKSERLLARLEVLRCGTCGARMVVGTSNNSSYHLYRCPPVGDCKRRVTISAELAETAVVDAVRAALEGLSGTASVEDGVDEAARELERCERELDAAVRAFSGLDDVDAARERLLELRAERDRAQDRLAELEAATAPAITVTAGDWDRLSLDGRRSLIRAVVERADVVPGRGPDRITVELRPGIRPRRPRKAR
jgi:hypothetical protein